MNPQVGLVEVTQQVLRSVSISNIGQDSRAHLAEQMRLHADSFRNLGANSPLAAHVAELASHLTAKGTPRKRQPPPSEALLSHVTEIYLAAVAEGSKTPVRQVEDQLRAEGVPVSARSGRAQVRNPRDRRSMKGVP